MRHFVVMNTNTTQFGVRKMVKNEPFFKTLPTKRTLKNVIYVTMQREKDIKAVI